MEQLSFLAASGGMNFPSVIEQSAAAASCRTAPHVDAIRELLDYAARCPVPVPDRARGVAYEPGVIAVPMVNSVGAVALIDEEDYPLIQRYRWRLESAGYAVACDGATVLHRMHRLVMMVGPSQVVDHRDHNTLDNRKANLRACTAAENSRNARIPSTNTTGVKGVSRTASGRFVAYVNRDGARFKSGHGTLEQATAWVEPTRSQLHGEFACARARRTDPATSHKAAERAAEFAGSHADRILRALVARGGRGTAKDIAALSGLSVVQVDRRRLEMVKAGTVRLALDEGVLVECDGFDVWEAC